MRKSAFRYSIFFSVFSILGLVLCFVYEEIPIIAFFLTLGIAAVLKESYILMCKIKINDRKTRKNNTR